MAKAKRPAAGKSNGATSRKPAARKTAAKSTAPATAKSSASAAASKASSASADVKTAVADVRTSVSPSEMKKALEAESKPMPTVAKESSQMIDVKEQPDVAEEKSSTLASAPAAAEQEKSGGVFWPLVFGGFIAAGLGFLASELDLLGTGPQTDDLRASIVSQDNRLSALEAVEPPVIPEIPEIKFPELDDLTTQVTALSGKLDSIDTRLTTLEKRPITEGSDQSKAAVAAYERELEALKDSVKEQRAEIEGLLDNAISVEQAAADSARVAKQQGALSALTSSINTGQPFADALATLSETGVTDLPAALNDTAADGVQTLNALQSEFPDSARAALTAARASGTNDAETGLGGFLKRQLGARSVTPREGNDPDAVLSRAEAAVREGRLNDALGELDALPAPAQEAMQDWLTKARTRHAAEAAAQELSQSLTAN